MPDILIIDDDATSRELIAYLLRHAGYDVRTAFDGEDGMRALREAVPDLVISDCQMPRRTGLEVAAWMKSDPILMKVPIVAVTASAMAADRQRASGVGFARYIIKPFDPTTVVREIEEVLRGSREE